jgi:hypothetical protein
MSEDRPDNAVMAQGNVGETMRAEEEQKEAEKEREEQGEGKEERPTDEELKERVVSRQEEKGKGEISAAAAKEDIINSKLPPASRQRTKKKSKAIKQKEPNLYNLSKQLEKHTKQLSNIESTVQQFSKYLKNTVIQSSILKQLNTSINQLQKQVSRIQRSSQKKSKQK